MTIPDRDADDEDRDRADSERIAKKFDRDCQRADETEGTEDVTED